MNGFNHRILVAHALTAAIIAVCLSIGCAPTADRIVFSSDRDGDNDIYLMNDDGSNVRQITHTESDGGQLVFIREPDDLWELHLIHPDGENLARLTNTPSDIHEPDWSPNGTRIVFASRSG